MGFETHTVGAKHVALLAEGVDRNQPRRFISTPSARRALLPLLFIRAWIEITAIAESGICGRVALLAEGVDRNNPDEVYNNQIDRVALLAEGVDRNWMRCSTAQSLSTSPSSRRAWIEIEPGQ